MVRKYTVNSIIVNPWLAMPPLNPTFLTLAVMSGWYWETMGITVSENIHLFIHFLYPLVPELKITGSGGASPSSHWVNVEWQTIQTHFHTYWQCTVSISLPRNRSKRCLHIGPLCKKVCLLPLKTKCFPRPTVLLYASNQYQAFTIDKAIQKNIK